MKQQYEGRIHVLEEQISSGKQNDEHYRIRLEAIHEDLKRRHREKEALSEEKSELMQSSGKSAEN